MAYELPWFPFFAADWLADLRVRAMSAGARGVFIDLLAYQWREGTVPADERVVARLAGSTEADALEALAFFEPVPDRPGHMKNARMEEHRGERARELLANHERAKLAAEARWQQERKRKADKDLMLEHCSSTARAMLEPCQSESESESEVNTTAPGTKKADATEASDAFFDRHFWPTYPRKISKKTARLKFRKVDPDEWAAVMEDVVARTARDQQWREKQYIPHPATYLNQERWKDEWEGKFGPEAKPVVRRRCVDCGTIFYGESGGSGHNCGKGPDTRIEDVPPGEGDDDGEHSPAAR